VRKALVPDSDGIHVRRHTSKPQRVFASREGHSRFVFTPTGTTLPMTTSMFFIDLLLTEVARKSYRALVLRGGANRRVTRRNLVIFKRWGWAWGSPPSTR